MSGPAKRQYGQFPSTEFKRVIPSEIASLFEQPPLLPSEDAESYKRLLTGLSVSVEREGRDRVALGPGHY